MDDLDEIVGLSTVHSHVCNRKKTSTHIQAVWTVHGVSPKSIIVSCRLTDNMAQGIHLRGTEEGDTLVNSMSHNRLTYTVNMLLDAKNRDIVNTLLNAKTEILSKGEVIKHLKKWKELPIQDIYVYTNQTYSCCYMVDRHYQNSTYCMT